jgi:aldehyde:ferredoxin oxidoreductase
VLDRDQFDAMLAQYYKDRGWDPYTTEPGESKLKELSLESI